MKLFCAYAFTGEDLDTVVKRMRLVVDTLSANGHEAYCNRFDPAVDQAQKKNDISAIFERALAVLGENEAVVAIVTSPRKSIGQSMEIGAAISQKKPVYLFQHQSAKNTNYLPQLAIKTFDWSTDKELVRALKQI